MKLGGEKGRRILNDICLTSLECARSSLLSMDEWYLLLSDRFKGLGRAERLYEYVGRRTRWDLKLACFSLALVLVCVFFVLVTCLLEGIW